LTKFEFQSSKTHWHGKSSQELFADLDQLEPAGGAGFDRDVGFWALEVPRDEGDHLFIGSAVDGRRFKLGEPGSVFLLLKPAGS
jgi:hypothetical protein